MRAAVRVVLAVSLFSVVGCGPEARFIARLENVAPFKYLKATSQQTRVGGGTGAIGPGQAYDIVFSAGKAHKVSFVAMLGQSNDWFFAPVPGGIPLYENGIAVTGDVTSYLRLWDAGTEVNEEPNVGAHTGPRQSTSTDGPGAVDANTSVREVPNPVLLSDGTTSFAVPAVDAMIRATLRQTATPGQWGLRIDNVSTTGTLVTSAGSTSVSISPVVLVVHTGDNALFTPGLPATITAGLEELAESGAITVLGGTATSRTGVATPISPGVWAVHPEGQPLFTLGVEDRGLGLEVLAEQGDPSALLTAVDGIKTVESQGVFNTPVDGALGPAQPGQAFEWEFQASGHDKLSLATMFGASNDWLFATPADGIAVFDASGQPRTGDLAGELLVIDVGTEANEELWVGPNTGPNQATPELGAVDGDRKVRNMTGTGYATPVNQHLKLTLRVK